jgi:hypothetical protein
MADFFELEKRFITFRDRLEEYRKLCIIILGDHEDLDMDKIYEEERELRNSLACEYGELQADIHGMAGYNMLDIMGKKIDIFLAALDPLVRRDNLIKEYGLEYVFQCINKAIGSCRHAKQVVRTDKQIRISKGAIAQGLIEIRNLILRARRSLFIQDRYLNADIFGFLDEIGDEIEVRILVQADAYKGKQSLASVFKAYSAKRKNVQINACAATEFHSRKLLIDDTEGYILDFTFQDVGKNESFLTKIENCREAIEEFDQLWAHSKPLVDTP